MKFIKWFNQIGLNDVASVGGKNASLGEMIQHLRSAGIKVPDGFAVSADGFWRFINHNKLSGPISDLLNHLSSDYSLQKLARVGKKIRSMIQAGTMPKDLQQEIELAYEQLSKQYHEQNCAVAVRSSATAEDLPTASFAGQQETYLNIVGTKQLLDHCKKGFASLYTDRAIVYRIEKGFEHRKIALSLGIQKMVRSDLACSGVAFSIDTETGFKDAIIINASYGLGEAIVQGLVNPDEFLVHKPTLQEGFASIIQKRCGNKKIKFVYSKSKKEPIKKVKVPVSLQQEFSLNDAEIIELARYVAAIENYYSAKKGGWSPMDVEWAKDGIDGQIYIVQARPETIHAAQAKKMQSFISYKIKGSPEPLIAGQSIGKKIVSGPAKIISSIKQINKVQKGDIIVTRMTDPDWVPVMKIAAGIITTQGGRTCHAAIVARELGIPAIVGAQDALSVIESGKIITMDCSQGSIGYVYAGKIDYKTVELSLQKVPELKTKLMVNLAEPETAFTNSFLPVDGVGLMRIEFIISNSIKLHPLAAVNFKKISDKTISSKIKKIIQGYKDPHTFFVDKLSEGVATIAAAFYPRPVIVRLSDFKSNEYRNLIGGTLYEPIEENPMLGWRGASRYYHPKYKNAFALECEAIKKVRDVMGLRNVKIMVPFVRTVDEAKKVINELANNGLKKGENNLEFVMMVEIPSNVLLIDQFSEYFNGFSIGSNDLTQLTLGIDRDSPDVADLFDERNKAATTMMHMAINGAHTSKRFIGICGQAPSDYPEIAHMLIEWNIDSISLNPDMVVPFLLSNEKKRP